MTKKYYVYSTLTDAVNYAVYRAGGGDLPIVDTNIVIQGGTNIPDKFLRTSKGVVTPVTEEELELLKANKVFQLHVDNGFISFSDKKVDPEVAAAGMQSRDEAAPLVDADFVEGEEPKSQGTPTDDDDRKPRSRKA